MTRAVLVLLLSLIAVTRFADGAVRTLRGRVVDAEGHGVAAVDVAPAWTIGVGGAKPRAGVTTDGDGRFTLSYASADAALCAVAYDATRARGAFAIVEPAALAEEQTLTLVPTVRVSGELSADEGKYYPADCVCFLAPAAGRVFSIRIDPEKGKFSVPLPPGSYVLVAEAPGRKNRSVDVVVAAGRVVVAASKPALAPAKLDLGKFDLTSQDVRADVGDLAPPVRLRVGSPELDATLVASHFPDRWTLFYFWGVT